MFPLRAWTKRHLFVNASIIYRKDSNLQQNINLRPLLQDLLHLQFDLDL